MPVAFGGDGLIGAVAGALSGTGGVLGRAAGRPRQRLRPLPRASRSTRSPACAVLAHGESDAGRPRCRRRTARSSGSPPAASTRTPTGSPTRRGWCAATSSTPTAACGRWSAGSPPRSRSASTASSTRSTATPSRSPTRRMHGGGMLLAPDASLDDGLFDVVMIADAAQAAVPAAAADGVQGHARRARRTSRSCAAREVEISADRPFTMYADGDPIAELPATLTRAARRAVRVMAPARDRGERRAMTRSGEDQSSPGRSAALARASRTRRRHQPARQGAARGSSRTRSASSPRVCPTAAR